jgi:hypothetical protein
MHYSAHTPTNHRKEGQQRWVDVNHRKEGQQRWVDVKIQIRKAVEATRNISMTIII